MFIATITEQVAHVDKLAYLEWYLNIIRDEGSYFTTKNGTKK